MKKTVYIAGPMRGRPDFNRAAFNDAARRLAAQGWQPINPVDLERILPCASDDGEVDYCRLSALMHAELAIVDRANAIYLLDGWTSSKGARRELHTFLGSAIRGDIILGPPAPSACGDTASRSARPLRNCDRFATAAEAAEAYDGFTKMCSKVSCSECRFCGRGIPCVLAWLYEEADEK